jgi:CheY-like chemotaxis protein
LSLQEVGANSSVSENLSEVLSAAGRAKELVRQILAFSRQNKQEQKPVNVSAIAGETLKLIRASMPTTIEIHKELRSEAVVMADPAQIHQILMNLFTNAGLAMRESGGVLDVSTEDLEVDLDFAQAHPGLSEGTYLQLKVSDSGCGMTEEIKKRIFEPFFTTRDRDEGTGMGLSVVHGIVSSHGGAITVYSEPGQGTTFNIYLPTIRVDVASDAEGSTPLPTGTERILFVDDEQFQVDLAKKMLGRLGYKVTALSSSLEALELFRSNPTAYDLVITDMTMPNMTGDVLAQQLFSVRPDIPIIICTGYSERMTEERALKLGAKGFALKPLVMKGFAEKIRDALG